MADETDPVTPEWMPSTEGLPPGFGEWLARIEYLPKRAYTIKLARHYILDEPFPERPPTTSYWPEKAQGRLARLLRRGPPGHKRPLGHMYGPGEDQ